MKRRGAGWSFIGALLFFVTIAVTVTVAILLNEYVNEKSGGDKGVIALVMLLVIIFLSLLCTLFDIFRRRIMIDRPVEQILAATERIASGDFTTRLILRHGYGNYDEYDVIMDNLNTLAEELGKSEVLKTDFVSNVSHELKTPLTVIRSYAELLRTEKDEALRKKYAETVSDAAKRLSELVTNILKLNKLENRALPPEKERIDLAENVAEAVLQFEDIIEKKGLELSCDLDEIRIYSSPSFLEIVWSNLLSNAIKFTNEGGKIEVSLKREHGNAVVRVKDSGEGISPETGKRIFDKFYQGDTSHAQEGNGLGLALVKKVIDILGGEISVESEQGKGSVFAVTLKENLLD